MTPAERAAACERILSPALAVLADQDSDPGDVRQARAVLAKVTDLIDGLHGIDPAAYARRTPGRPGPHDARARACEAPPAEIGDAVRRHRNEDRAEAGLHFIRKGRNPCEAANRDGSPCQAPAIPGGSVCRRHGGSAPQVAISARHMELLLAHAEAAEAHQAARGTPGEFDSLCAWSRARNELDEYEAKLTRLRELRAELKRREEANQ